ncbi:hypothetical protein ASG48_04365 [Aurantimonas sp. Leaf443]|nr:hypothetical protein ASG48_04365 [Aurantimonas sp. Leaf443]
MFVAATAIDFVTALYFWALWLGRREQRVYLWIAASATSATLGCLLFMLREVVPDWLAVWAAQLFIIQIFAFLWAAVRLVHARSRSVVETWIGSALWTGACLVPAFFEAEPVRNAVATLAFTAYCAAMCVELLRPHRARASLNRIVTVVSLLLLTGFSILLAVYSALNEDVVAPLRKPDPLAALWLLAYMVIYVMLVMAVTTLELGNEADREREAATTDALTGLFNRRAFLARSERLMARAGGATLLVLDIDHFKRINDLFGHAAGDEALVRFAAVLRLAIAGFATDGPATVPLVARLGGEEFVCLVPGTNEAAAARLAERIRSLVERDLAATGGPGMTVSIGLAASPAGIRTVGDLLLAADKALYRAKNGGRNRVEQEEAAEPFVARGPGGATALPVAAAALMA